MKLTATAKAAGCAAKLSPSLLEAVLRRLPAPNDPNVLVGFETSDDAGVYRVSDDLALVQTIDFFTPIVDDPFLFGQIAAANALSDVYAMGGRPVSALSVVAFPPNGAPELLEQIMRGGLSKMDEAGATVLGGHSIRDDELKFGYAVTGCLLYTSRGSSGPITVTSGLRRLASSTRPATSFKSAWMHSASSEIPPLPGAHQIFSTAALCLSFQTIACSRPPPPITRIFISFSRERNDTASLGGCQLQHS